jgi:hypothetical protein
MLYEYSENFMSLISHDEILSGIVCIYAWLSNLAIINVHDIVWSRSTYASLLRWVLEFGFQVNRPLEYRPFEKLNRSNRIRLCGFVKNNLPDLDLKIC